VVFAPRVRSASEASARARRIFDEAARRDLHLALADLPSGFFAPAAGGMDLDRPTVTCLRSVLMKAEHADWVDRIAAILDASSDAVTGADPGSGDGFRG